MKPFMNDTILIRELRAARYKLLVGVRPLAPARSAWNFALSAIADSLSSSDSTLRDEVIALKLEESI